MGSLSDPPTIHISSKFNLFPVDTETLERAEYRPTTRKPKVDRHTSSRFFDPETTKKEATIREDLGEPPQSPVVWRAPVDSTKKRPPSPGPAPSGPLPSFPSTTEARGVSKEYPATLISRTNPESLQESLPPRNLWKSGRGRIRDTHTNARKTPAESGRGLPDTSSHSAVSAHSPTGPPSPSSTLPSPTESDFGVVPKTATLQHYPLPFVRPTPLQILSLPDQGSRQQLQRLQGPGRSRPK